MLLKEGDGPNVLTAYNVPLTTHYLPLTTHQRALPGRELSPAPGEAAWAQTGQPGLAWVGVLGLPNWKSHMGCNWYPIAVISPAVFEARQRIFHFTDECCVTFIRWERKYLLTTNLKINHNTTSMRKTNPSEAAFPT